MLTQKSRVLNYLKTGKNLTKYHAENRMNIGNPREVIRQLREEGHVIYTNRNKNAGNAASYRLGSPTRSMIRRVYNQSGARIFN
jgi:hypothetical protein